MNWGSLAGGLAEGLGSGYRTGMLATNLKNQNEMEQRRMGIVEEDARQRRQINDLTVQRQQRDMDRDAREEASYKEALSALMPDPSNVDPNLPASEQFGRTLMGMKPNAAQWTAAANALAKNGNTKALEFMNFAWKAREEGAFDALHALNRGDMEGAKNAFNAAGQNRLKSIEPTGEGPDGTQSGVFKFTYDDGSSETHNVREAFSMLSSPSAYARYTQDLRKQQEESEKNQADVGLKRAQTISALGDNPTKIRVAEIGADKARDVAATKATKGGGRKGGGKGDDEGPDMLDATRRVQIQKDVDDFVRSNFGTPDPVTGDPGKARHNDKSRRLSTIAAQLMMAAENGGKPMTIQDAGRLAAEGKAVQQGVQIDPKGRLVTQQSWELNGQVYPMGSGSRALEKEEVLQLIDQNRESMRVNGLNPTADQLKATTEVRAMAKQAGISVDEVVKRMLDGPDLGAKGMVEKGNIDLTKRKVLNNPDGSISTESSITITEKGKDGKEMAVNIPTVIDGKRYSDKDAVAYYRKNGEHLGKFSSIADAEAAAQNTHLDQEKRYVGQGGGGGIISEASAGESAPARGARPGWSGRTYNPEKSTSTSRGGRAAPRGITAEPEKPKPGWINRNSNR